MSVEFNVYKYKNVLAAHLKGVLPSGSIKNFHLALLIDQSGSMEGARIDEVKNTLHEMVRILKPDDKISLITYSNSAEVLINCMKAEGNIDLMNNRIDSINADGGTNLESAFLKISELSEVPDAVFILTDGIVNIGITSSSGLQTILGLFWPVQFQLVRLGMVLITINYSFVILQFIRKVLTHLQMVMK